MKLLVVVCLFAVCYAQPVPTEIPETFTATLSIMREREEKPAMGSWDRNAAMMEYMRRETFTTEKGTGTMERLGLYEKKMEYTIIMGANGTHCRPEKIPEDREFPKVWDWLSDPKTKKSERTMNGTTYIVYTYTDGEMTRELEVSAANPSRPLRETEESKRGKEETRYTTFEPMAPSQTVFEVPEACHTPPPRRRV